MKTRALLIAGLMMLAGTSAFAAIELAQANSQPPAVFGDSDHHFDIVVSGIDLPGAVLRVELFQVAGKLALPLGTPATVPGSHDLASTTPARISLPIHIPAVKAPANILARLSATNAGTAAPKGIGEITFTAYPANLLQSVIAHLAPLPNGDARLIVFGGGTRLRPALRALHIPFEDAGGDLPGHADSNRLYLGDLAQPSEQVLAQDRRADVAHLAILAADDSIPAGLYADYSNDRAFVLVTLPILDHLGDDPRAQLVLLKIFQALSTI